MFLGIEWKIFGVMSIPFLIIISFVALLAIIYIAYLILLITRYRTKMNLVDFQNLFLDQTTEIPDYEPAIMGYLVNYQKIGKREICSTLLDLIGRKVIKITLISGFVSDNDSKYILKINEKEKNKLEEFELLLVDYLFEQNNTIQSEKLSEKLYKNKLDDIFYSNFLRAIQSKAKTYDFFDSRTAKIKVMAHKIVNKILTIVASIMTVLSGFIGQLADFGGDDEFTFSLFILSLATAGVLWCFKFLITFMYNVTCYYNDFSKNGNKDYKKWMGFKKYLINCSTIKEHPLMGVLVWERYYAYAIGLKCGYKFFEQMKKMKVVDNSIDIKLFEIFDDIIREIGVSSEGVKSISIDEFGGSHINY